MSKGRPIVISAPSGVGKSTVCRYLQAHSPDLAISISYTTRAPRGREQHGVDYHFVDQKIFARMEASGDLLEWAMVHGHRYGSGRARTEELLAQGTDVLFDIDVQGGAQIRRVCSDALLVFLLPPSIETLVGRLRGRGTESPAQVQERLQAAVAELAQGVDYPYHVVNEKVPDAAAEINAIRKRPAADIGQQTERLQALIDQAQRRSQAGF